MSLDRKPCPSCGLHFHCECSAEAIAGAVVGAVVAPLVARIAQLERLIAEVDPVDPGALIAKAEEKILDTRPPYRSITNREWLDDLDYRVFRLERKVY